MYITICVDCGDKGTVNDEYEWASRNWRCPVCGAFKKPLLQTPEGK